MAECIISGRQGPKGDIGPQGIQGPTGPQGPTGSSASIKITNVNISVSNTSKIQTVIYSGIIGVFFRGYSNGSWLLYGLGNHNPFRIQLYVASSYAQFTWATSGTGAEGGPAAILYTG